MVLIGLQLRVMMALKDSRDMDILMTGQVVCDAGFTDLRQFLTLKRKVEWTSFHRAGLTARVSGVYDILDRCLLLA